MAQQTPTPKLCARCGRAFSWRKKWERSWDSVRYCSNACRAARNSGTDTALELAILELLSARAPDASICPSEAARRVDPDNWRRHMEAARSAARRLAHRGDVTITQRGRPVDPTGFRGPIRIARA